jgi:ABC-type Na+ transport system ATPase subunit NatA
MDNKVDVWDRDELKCAIQDITADSGQFVCLLGGKSTGKSLVIRYFERLNLKGCNMGTVLVIDLRIEGSDILKGLMAVIDERPELYVDSKSQGDLHVLKSLAGLAASFLPETKNMKHFLNL